MNISCQRRSRCRPRFPHWWPPSVITNNNICPNTPARPCYSGVSDGADVSTLGKKGDLIQKRGCLNLLPYWYSRDRFITIQWGYIVQPSIPAHVTSFFIPASAWSSPRLIIVTPQHYLQIPCLPIYDDTPAVASSWQSAIRHHLFLCCFPGGIVCLAERDALSHSLNSTHNLHFITPHTHSAHYPLSIINLTNPYNYCVCSYIAVCCCLYVWRFFIFFPLISLIVVKQCFKKKNK